MGIDRIGKGGPPPVVSGTGAPSAAKGVETPFAVEAPGKVAGPATVDATSPLARLRAGELDVNGYVDHKVAEATRGLSGLSATELADIKAALRERLASDPGLVDLVRSASGGQAPSLPED